MEIKGVNAYTPSVKPAGKTQVPVAPPDPASQGTVAPVRGDAAAPRGRVQAKDLLSEDEQRYLETLFPGATGAADTYAGKGRSGAVTPGSLVDRKG